MRMSVFVKLAMMAVCGVMLAGCASNPNQQSKTAAAQTIPVESKFSKIAVGMSMKQVYDLIGTPTDTRIYSTGKIFIPFYFGSDGVRTEALYKGEGRIVFTGIGVSGSGYRVYRIKYDPAEPGYNNKK